MDPCIKDVSDVMGAMDKSISFIGNPVTIYDKYIELLENDGYTKYTNNKKSKKISSKHNATPNKIFYVKRDKIEYRIDEPEMSIIIFIGDFIRPTATIFVDCNDILPDSINKHAKSLLKRVRIDDYTIIIVHPTESRVKIANHYFKCIPFEKIRSIIESYNVYHPYSGIDDILYVAAKLWFKDTFDLYLFTKKNPMITVCCAEKEIEYPDFVHINSSKDIRRKMTAVTFNCDFSQISPWKNVTTVLNDLHYVQIGQKRSKSCKVFTTFLDRLNTLKKNLCQ